MLLKEGNEGSRNKEGSSYPILYKDNVASKSEESIDVSVDDAAPHEYIGSVHKPEGLSNPLKKALASLYSLTFRHHSTTSMSRRL